MEATHEVPEGQQSTESDQQSTQTKEPSHIHLPYYNHSDDHLNAFQKAIKLVQSKLGLAPHTPKEGQTSGRQYYSVKRDQIQQKPETGSKNQPQSEPSNS